MEYINDYILIFPFEEKRDRPNISLIVGSNYNVLVDFGISKFHLNDALMAFCKEGVDYPLIGVLTHYHYDHSFAMPFFNGVSIGCKRTNDYLNVLSKVKMDESFINSYLSGESLKFCLDAIKEEYSDFNDICVRPCDVGFNSYLRLDLGD